MHVWDPGHNEEPLRLKSYLALQECLNCKSGARLDDGPMLCDDTSQQRRGRHIEGGVPGLPVATMR